MCVGEGGREWPIAAGAFSELHALVRYEMKTTLVFRVSPEYVGVFVNQWGTRGRACALSFRETTSPVLRRTHTHTPA